MLPSQRHLFDIPDNIAYFNCASNSPQLIESRERLIKGSTFKCHPWQRTPNHFFDDAETIRTLAAEIFGGDADGYAIVPAASYGISTAARAIEPSLKAGDQILIIAEEFPSNVLPWLRIAKETNAQIVTVAKPDNENWTEAILGKINSNVKVVAISACHWTNGEYIELPPIANACRNIAATLVVDATQVLAAMPFSMTELQPDFLVAAGYKWLLSPYGFSLMYVSERWRDARPLEESWLGRQKANSFVELVKYSDAYMPGARRFDVGEKCTPTILPGAIAALEQIEKWGIDNIASSLLAINQKITAQLDQLEFKIAKSKNRCPHMFGAMLPEHYKGDLVAKLAEQNIYLSQRGKFIRFAPHLHNNEQDINHLLNALTKLVLKNQ